MKKKKIVAIIPARGGSKGIKRKNIITLLGKPLLAHTIEAAKRCKLIDKIVVSTDDADIARIARKYGAQTPFIRPKKIAKDTSPSIHVLQHAVLWLEKNQGYKADIVVYLQITDVFRKDYMLTEVIKRLLDNSRIDSVFVGYKTHKNYWRNVNGKYKRLAEDMDMLKVRQKKEPLFREDAGLASATRAHLIKKGIKIGKNVDIVINDDFKTSIDIHEPFDLWLTEKIIKSKKWEQ